MIEIRRDGMSAGSVFLEDSDGNLIENPTEQQIRSCLERIGNGLDHCILDLGNRGYVQTTGGRSRLLLQYADTAGMYESSRSDLSVSDVAGVFASALNGKVEWKTTYDFNRIGDGIGEGASTEADSPGRATGSGQSSAPAGGKKPFKDQLLDSVKQEVQGGVNRMVRNGVRGLFGKKF
jgi:hypothetical protein